MPFTQRVHRRDCPLHPRGGNPQETLVRRYHQVRQFTESLCQPLVTEDYVIQAMPDVSPPKWHLAHTSWFFRNLCSGLGLSELSLAACLLCLPVQFLLRGAGERHCRPKRGLLSRPTVEEVYRYRAYVDQQMTAFFGGSGWRRSRRLVSYC